MSYVSDKQSVGAGRSGLRNPRNATLGSLSLSEILGMTSLEALHDVISTALFLPHNYPLRDIYKLTSPLHRYRLPGIPPLTSYQSQKTLTPFHNRCTTAFLRLALHSTYFTTSITYQFTLPTMMRSYRLRGPSHTRISAIKAQQRPNARIRTAPSRRQFSQSTCLAYPRKDSQDKDSMNTEATEYSKSATDDEGARHDDAAFNPDITDPQQQKDKAGEGTGEGTVSKSVLFPLFTFLWIGGFLRPWVLCSVLS